MRFQHFFLSFTLGIAIVSILGTIGLASFAQRSTLENTHPDIVGTYQCFRSYTHALGISCSIQPPLVIHADGTYQHAKEKGEIIYNSSARSLSLPGSSIMGIGTLANKKIIFTASFGASEQTTIYIHEDMLPL